MAPLAKAGFVNLSLASPIQIVPSNQRENNAHAQAEALPSHPQLAEYGKFKLHTQAT